MTTQCYLGVDLGASSGRVMAGLFDGREMRIEEVHRFENGPVHYGESLRWDVLRLSTEIENGLRAAAARYSDGLVSVGVDTWGVDYVLMTETDELLGQPYNYRDSRTRGMLDYACSRVSKAEIFDQTGIQFMEINTLYQLLAMNRSNPSLMELADQILLMPDYFHWTLCGSKAVEFTNATTTQCYHPTKREWSYDLLRRLELPTKMFGETVPPGTKLGRLRESVAKRVGLPRINVVAPPTHDTAAAVAAVPTAQTGTANWCYISSGTWSLMGIEVPQAVVSATALKYNLTNEGGIDGTYRLLKNIMGLWLVQECKRSFERRGNSVSFAELTRMAEQARPLEALVNPDDGRFLSPEDMVSEFRSFCSETGQGPPDSEGALVRCALESLALKYRMVLEQLEELSGERIETIHIVGGGAHNALLNQFTSNACGRPVLAGPTEATVLGNLLVQARTQGEVGSLADIREIVGRSTQLFEYTPTDSAAWDHAYERFLQLVHR